MKIRERTKYEETTGRRHIARDTVGDTLGRRRSVLQEGCHQVGLSPMGDPHGSRDTPRGLWPTEVPMPEQRSIKKLSCVLLTTGVGKAVCNAVKTGGCH